jgi:hypothetical protein
MPLDKLKADKLQRNRSRQRRRVENKDQRDAVPSQRHKQSAASCHLEIGPKPVDDTFTLNFAEWFAKRVLRLETSGIQQDNELYTRLECFPFTGQYYLLIKQKLAMDLNRFSVNFICMFTQIMWFYVMGPSVSNKKLCDLWSKN